MHAVAPSITSANRGGAAAGIPLDNGSIRGAIVDAQSRLNVNALGASGATAGVERVRLQRLFEQRGGPATALDAIADWIDADTIPRSRGAEDAYYLAQPTPALTADALCPARRRTAGRAAATEGGLAAVAASSRRCRQTRP
jgi:hypothetical protein